MANPKRGSGKSAGSWILGLLNPVRDPSLLVAIILTVIEEGGSSDPAYRWVLFGLLNWVAVKAVIWLLVNFAFSFVYLVRKTFWVIRHPRLAWRLLDAMGTEEIIIGGLRPDMFATEEGGLHEGQLGYAGLAGAYAGALGGGAPAPYGSADGAYPDYQGNGYAPNPRTEEMQEFFATYSRLVADWMAYTEEKWRAVSDSQLGWKPLRGRWNSWDEIYADAFAAENLARGGDSTMRRFENSQVKGSAASAVACFMHDLDSLRQMMVALEADGAAGSQRAGGVYPSQPMTQRTAKSPIIRNPRIVDAD
ncbi:MAG: hypothetical protein IVW57_02320 [Ktedonobacterales bacterium]|nr:hypothetical protein [Ktedonobacterales bacterium]